MPPKSYDDEQVYQQEVVRQVAAAVARPRTRRRAAAAVVAAAVVMAARRAGERGELINRHASNTNHQISETENDRRTARVHGNLEASNSLLDSREDNTSNINKPQERDTELIDERNEEDKSTDYIKDIEV